MASKKPTLLVIIGALLIAWILISSIHPIQPVVTAGGSTQSQQSTNGEAGGSGFSFFKFPSLSFHFPNLFNFNWPNLNFTFPSFNFKWPTIHWPNLGLGSGTGSGLGSTGLCQNQGICQNGSGGGSGNSAGDPGSSGQNDPPVQTQSTTRQQVPFTIPRDLLIATVVVILVIAGIFLALRSKNATLNRPRRNFQQALVQTTVPVIPTAKDSEPDESLVLQFEADEKIDDFRGWGYQGGFLRPKIDQSFPLIWGLDEPLEIEAPAGSTVYVGRDSPVEMWSSTAETLSGTVSFSEPSGVIHGSYQDSRDAKWIRSVHYDEDVMKLFRLNFLLNSQEENRSGELTPREIVTKIISERPELVKDSTALLSLARIFERAFYGKKKISRQEYEVFLRSLSKALVHPKVIICGPKSSQ